MIIINNVRWLITINHVTVINHNVVDKLTLLPGRWVCFNVVTCGSRFGLVLELCVIGLFHSRILLGVDSEVFTAICRTYSLLQDIGLRGPELDRRALYQNPQGSFHSQRDLQ